MRYFSNNSIATRRYLFSGKTTILTVIFIVVFSSVSAFVSDTIYIPQHDKKQDSSIVDKIRILEDKTRLLTIKDVMIIDSGFVKSDKNILDYGASESTYWIKFTIVNTDELLYNKRYIVFTSVDIHELKFYHFDGENIIKKESITGNTFNYDYKERLSYAHGFTFLITLEPKSINTFYVYLDHRYQVLTPDIKLLNNEQFLKRTTNEHFYSGLIIGSVFMFLLIAASLLLFFRQAIHLNYFIYLIGVMIFLLSFNGGGKYVWPNWSYFQDPSQYIGPSILLIGFIGVFRLFFRLKHYSVMLDRFFQGLRLIVLFLIIGFLFWKYIGSYYTILYTIMSLFYFICSILFIVISLYVYKKERKEEYLWFITSMFLLIITSSLILLTEQTSFLKREDFEFVFKYLPDLTLYYESTILCFFLTRRVYREKLIYERQIMIERERIRLGLHDEANTDLAGIKMVLKSMVDEFEESQPKTKLESVYNRVTRVISDIREIINGSKNKTKYFSLILPEIKRFVLEHFEDQKTIPHFSFKVPEDKNIMLPIQLRMNLVGFFKELVYNSKKYSNAENFRMEIEIKGNTLTCIIRDDGIGFDYQTGITHPSGDGNGLQNLKKRAKRMKAVKYNYNTQPGKGVEILLEIDFKQYNDGDYI